MENHQTLTGEAIDAGRAGPPMTAAAELFKAVAHPVRAHILELLSQGESSIPELCEGTGVKATHLSRHLNQMRGQHLIQCQWTGGRLVYRLAYPQATELLAAARSVLQARTAAAVSSLGTAREEQPFPALSDGQFFALEASLESRSVIGDACQAIAARTGCSPEEASGQLLSTARSSRITLLEAARDELRKEQERPS
ncbi:DNA-binding transcriptional ArsR family regulator [Pseudarthrobacter siccitolerans]|uniref:DNA-binding transcriptional ArsR family regulator n=1 Tax=Pseudarthrobacter siccitolerans TaxID=861266 RepID=A0ABU0PL43_9MICC|nr:metalloregulator ArsR/SmtB family transcription factor [Pseudarthrobacter siccitolerans]MDQ0673969.1 DNA-binding transcriptional ArsR family regulator [Pseudarthrobacter siccitolerans]